jgi:hypothetical protein
MRWIWNLWERREVLSDHLRKLSTREGRHLTTGKEERFEAYIISF